MNVMKFLKRHYIPGKLVGASPLTLESYRSIVRRFRALLRWHVSAAGLNSKARLALLVWCGLRGLPECRRPSGLATGFGSTIQASQSA